MTPEALAALDRLSAPPSVSELDRLGREFGVENARWAAEQFDLRRRARTKFARAGEMLFVREALEQATHEAVARYHASRFPDGALVADLTTGIGGDLIALAERGPAVGYEIDPARAALARHNLGGRCDVRESSGLEFPEEVLYAFADPARRVEGRRTLRPEDFQPSLESLVPRLRRCRLAGLKLSPLLADEFLEGLGGSLEFVSYQGECREALIWLGAEAEPGRWAVQVDSGARLAAGFAPPVVETPLEWLLEADPAAIRAHALGGLGLVGLGDSNGYLTAAEPVDSSWLRQFRVLHHGPADLKRTQAALRELAADRPVLKQRGAGLNLPGLAKKLRPQGSRRVALVIWPIGRSLVHTIVEATD